jgi:hypothetical protein
MSEDDLWHVAKIQYRAVMAANPATLLRAKKVSVQLINVQILLQQMRSCATGSSHTALQLLVEHTEKHLQLISDRTQLAADEASAAAGRASVAASLVRAIAELEQARGQAARSIVGRLQRLASTAGDPERWAAELAQLADALAAVAHAAELWAVPAAGWTVDAVQAAADAAWDAKVKFFESLQKHPKSDVRVSDVTRMELLKASSMVSTAVPMYASELNSGRSRLTPAGVKAAQEAFENDISITSLPLAKAVALDAEVAGVLEGDCTLLADKTELSRLAGAAP